MSPAWKDASGSALETGSNWRTAHESGNRIPTWLLIALMVAAVTVVGGFSQAVSPAVGCSGRLRRGCRDGEFSSLIGGDSTRHRHPDHRGRDRPASASGQSGDNGVAGRLQCLRLRWFWSGALQVAGTPQDWSTFPAFHFWFYGTGSGLTYQAEISDNRSDPNQRHLGALRLQLHRRHARLAVHQHPL